MDDLLQITWLSEPFDNSPQESPSKIVGPRRMEHLDIPELEKHISMKTLDIFGDFDLGRIYEASCLSIVQFNEHHDVVSGICLCNYPNVPAVPADGWLSWIKNLYGVESVTEMNTLFVHFLVWDKRYEDSEFFGDLLAGLFKLASYCLHVILVLPPRVAPDNQYQKNMKRILANSNPNCGNMQSLYTTARDLVNPTLRNRRLVEEDNDDVIPIIDEETSLLRELYGEYYISEMVRYPDGHRQLVVSETPEGVANGVMCLNRALDVDILNENFQLVPYNGLRKPHENDHLDSFSFLPDSELYDAFFPRKFPTTSEIRCPSFIEEKSYDPFEDEAWGEENLRSMNSNNERCLDDESLIGVTILEESEEEHGFEDNQSSTVGESRGSLSVKMESVTFGSEPSKEEMKEDDDGSHLDSTAQVPFQASLNISEMTFLNRVPSTSDYLSLYYHSRARVGPIAYSLPPRSKKDTEKSVSRTLLCPMYHGERNAFALEIFATRKEIANQYTLNFLEASFECFPDLDYCVVLVPYTHHYFSFLEHAVRVPPKCDKDFPRALYLAHRAALLGDIQARRAYYEDEENVRDLLHGIPKNKQVFLDFQASVKSGSILESYVFLCSGKLVGVAILCVEENSRFLKRRYHVEDYVVLENITWNAHKRILHFVLMPVFTIHNHDFLREIMRLSGAIVLYYRLYESDNSFLTRSHPITTCLSALIPVNPRRRIEYRFMGYVETDENPMDESFSLFLTTPRLTTCPFSIVDTRIVIIGGSNCGVALAEQLTLGSLQQFVHYSNVTIISPDGLPFEIKRSEEVLRMLPFRGRYSQDYRHLVAIRSWLNIIYGTVISINRRRKYVMIMNQGKISYDYLILTCGLQYQKPMFEEELHAKNTGEMIPFEKPWNCLSVNNDTDAHNSLEKIQQITQNLEKKSIVFYGHNIDCYCALQGLLEFGIDGNLITLIEPPLGQCEKHHDIFFSDCEVDTEIMRAIINKGVTVLFGYTLTDWVLTESAVSGKKINSLLFEIKGQTKRIPCDAFFDFSDKKINTEIFLAICRTGLVFDGRLVIDPECRTNDPNVFAVGSITKYSRKFFADSWLQKYYNNVEIGEQFAKDLRTVIDVDQSGDETQINTQKVQNYPLLPVFRTPVIIACTLPGGYHYLHVRKPGKKIVRDVAIEHDAYGQVLVTGSCHSEIGYFRIRLNNYDTVETVTCLNKKSFEVHHMIALYGKHESLLNELKLQFRNSLIVDFFAYFREPWATAIFYDKFECFQVENRATLLSKLSIESDSLVDDCLNALKSSNWESMSKENRRIIQEKFPGSVYHLDLEESLIDFLQTFEDDLPMYCTPEKRRLMYADNQASPLFN